MLFCLAFLFKILLSCTILCRGLTRYNVCNFETYFIINIDTKYFKIKRLIEEEKKWNKKDTTFRATWIISKIRIREKNDSKITLSEYNKSECIKVDKYVIPLDSTGDIEKDREI